MNCIKFKFEVMIAGGAKQVGDCDQGPGEGYCRTETGDKGNHHLVLIINMSINMNSEHKQVMNMEKFSVRYISPNMNSSKSINVNLDMNN